MTRPCPQLRHGPRRQRLLWLLAVAVVFISHLPTHSWSFTLAPRPRAAASGLSVRQPQAVRGGGDHAQQRSEAPAPPAGCFHPFPLVSEGEHGQWKPLVGAASFMVLVGAAGAAVAATTAVDDTASIGVVLQQAARRAVGGGAAGAAAAVAQVLSLMWLRTTMNYQYRYGTSLPKALSTLYGNGGIPRLYQGLPFALVQGPAARFGDTAANAFALALLQTSDMDMALKTACASSAAALWRIVITPIDTVKTTFQVEGSEAAKTQLTQRVKDSGVTSLWDGALANSAATFVGHYPWFLTYNALSSSIQAPPDEALVSLLVYNAFLGLCSSIVSDTCSNSIRVVKTTKQTFPKQISYLEAIRQVVDESGIAGLFGRGLQTRYLVNGLQGMLFSVAWKYFQTAFSSSS